MQKLAACGALSLALALLSLQVILALEYTDGGTFGTQASMIVAMITLALLPVFIEAARRSGHRAIAVALFVAFAAFLAYSLPATTGRTGEIKETKVAAAGDVAKLRDDLERTTKMADWARQDWMTECGSGEGKKCRAKRNTVQALEDRVAKLNGDIKAAGAATGDMGSDLWAWATGLPSATVRKVSVLSFAIGMDMAIWALIWLATGLLSAPVLVATPVRDTLTPASDTAQTSYPATTTLPAPQMFAALPEPTPPTPKKRKRKSKHENAAAWLKSEAEKNGGVPSFRVVQGRFHLSKASASRIRSEVMREIDKVA